MRRQLAASRVVTKEHARVESLGASTTQSELAKGESEVARLRVRVNVLER